jgi:hypothetical protein
MSNKEFRAKVYSRNRRTGEYYDCGWVYGDFYRYYNGSLNYTIAAIDADEMETKEYSVEGTTVGQWSGLYDKNKKKIFEGDRIVTRWVNVVNSDKPVTEIYYTVTNILDFEIMYKMQCADEIEVIGNVHDSPELHDGSNTA